MIKITDEKNKKLISIYQLKYDMKMIIFLLPFVLYCFIFNHFLTELVVGSFIFTYIALFLVFVNRYFMEIVKLPYIHLMKWNYECRLISLKPNIVPMNLLKLRHVLTLEIAPILCVEAIYMIIYFVSKNTLTIPYLTNLILAIIILNMLLIYKNVRYLFHILLYRENYTYGYTIDFLFIYLNL